MTRPLLLVGLLTGCTKKIDTDSRWWEVDGPNPVSEDDEDEDDDEEEDEAIFYGELRATDSGYEGLEAGVEVIEGGDVLCELFFTPEDIKPDGSCASCEEAVSFVAGELEREAGGGCADFGVEPDALESERLYLGWSGEEAWLKVDGSWVEVGEIWTEDDVIGWDIWLD